MLWAATHLPADAQKTPQAPSTAQSLPAGSVEVSLTSIMDPRGYDRPMIAAKALVPKGWRTQGGVIWPQATCGELARFDWAAISPDGLSRVELVPTEAWGASTTTQGPCQYGEFQDMQSYLAAWIQRRHPDARITGYTPRPEYIDLQGDLRWAIQHSYIDYRWELDTHLRVDRLPRPAVGILAAGGVRYLGVDGTRGRDGQTGYRAEGGVRFEGSGGAVELFVGAERRIDPYPLEFGTATWMTAGFRLLSR